MSYPAPANFPLSDARLNANRQNAQLSSGPKTPQGKSVSSRNAVRTALTGRTVLLPTDDADRYEVHVKAFVQEIQPVGQRETILTQSLADIAWRIERIASFEMAIFAKGRAFLADAYADEPEAIRPHLIELEIQQQNERELRNLQLQEARLRRQRDKDNEELRHLQTERKRLAEQQLDLAAHYYRKAKAEEKPFDPAALGFEFSTTDVEHFLERRKLEAAIRSANASQTIPLKRSNAA
jgi:hypothetical protein